MKIYISGPMTGYENLNFEAFNEAEIRLIRAGATPRQVINPASFLTNTGKSWEACLRYDLTRLLECNAVVTLLDWQASKGARLEVHVATELGMPVHSVDDWIRAIRRKSV